MGRGNARALAALALAAAALVSCSEDDGPSTVLPSSAFPDETGSLTSPTGPSGGTGSTGTLPTGPTATPPELEGPMETGVATVTVSGGVNANKTMPELFTGVYSPPPGGLALVWTAGGTDSTTLALGGLSFTGTQPTAPTLSLTLNVQTRARIFVYTSVAGECSVTIGVASDDELAGAFTCSDLAGSEGEVVDATGTFTAQG